MKPSATIERISPKQAREILDTSNSENFRRLDSTYVADLSRAMDKGEWDANGEAIIFDEKGSLLDGQHRLAACVKSGKAIETVVVRGIQHQYVRSIDVGRKRTVAQYLTSQGVKYSTFITASLRLFFSYEAGERGKSVFHLQHPPQAYIDYLDERHLNEMYDLIHSLAPSARFCSLSILVGMTMIGMKRYSRTKALEWAIGVATSSAPLGTPANKLNKRLHDEFAKSSSGHANRWLQALLMARSMKAHCEGSHLDKLMWGKSKTAVIPEFDGKPI